MRQDATALAIRRGDKVLESDAKRLGNKGTIAAVARLTAGILLDNSPTLDADPDVLNVQNGVVDLRTGTLRERWPEDYFTKIASVDYVPARARRTGIRHSRPYRRRRGPGCSVASGRHSRAGSPSTSRSPSSQAAATTASRPCS
ncbi:hypothetical protein, partial [Streptomyces brasiliscabiei]|uniref:hypothetical protein n=1 Tax=Streptomyces brasiliscabiei TaxID=2736302 RepID=UPI003014D6CB